MTRSSATGKIVDGQAEREMNIFGKILIGWVVWSIGVPLYALASFNAPGTGTAGTGTAPEVFYGVMAACYLVGVPILTRLWILRK